VGSETKVGQQEEVKESRARGRSDQRGRRERRERFTFSEAIADDLASLNITSQALELATEADAGSNNAVHSSLKVKLGGRGHLLVGLQRSWFAEVLLRDWCMAEGERCIISYGKTREADRRTKETYDD
jgi:hypothetical protein